jgi:hypothetical protein
VTYPYPPPQPGKSNKGLIIGLGIGALALLLVMGGLGIVLVSHLGDDDPDPASTTAVAEPGPSEQASEEPTGEEEADNGGNNAITAKYAADFEIVCQGGSVLNAAGYSPGKRTKAYVFANSLPQPETYSYQVTYTGRFYGSSSAVTQVGVVGCLTAVTGSEGPGRKCVIQDADKKRVTIDHVSSRFRLTFRAARTGEKLGDGGTVNAPATRCPFLVRYDPATRKSYALPDDAAVTAAFEKFMS